ncbi:DUF2207 domain-containing protein [Candidatus Bipolaricaulota bacterium]
MSRALAVPCILLLTCVAAFASLRVDHFDARLELLEDGTLLVEEQITVTFSTPHHGIERTIPVSYRLPSTGASLTISFDLQDVGLDGADVQLVSKRRGRSQYLRLGDPNRTILGTHTYAIAYTLDRVLHFRDDHLQLYLNVTGNEWRVPIDRVTTTLRLPTSVDPGAVTSTHYVGYLGESTRAGAATVDPSGQLIFESGSLGPGEGLTIDLAIPRDALPIQPPSVARRALWFLDANKAAALPIVVLVAMVFLWFKVGRDPRKGIIAPAFAPPHGMHPGEVGVLIDDRIDLRDISAMVVGLAVNGHLRIEEVRDDDPGLLDKAKDRLGRSSPLDYRFVRRERPTDDISDVEKLLLDAIFVEEQTEQTLSSLETSFYKHLPAIRSRLYGGLIERGYYASNPERTRGFYRSLGLFGLAAGVAAGVAFGSLYLAAAVAASGLVILAFSPIMPRKTRKGARALEDVLGLARYIELAEVDRIEFHDAPEKSPEVFERLLPYAIALNLTKIWTDRFEGLLDEPPDWYRGAGPVFRGHWFALSMLHLSSGMNRTFASAPRTVSSGRSAWGGGSSFGGGFSGGGFGGGGGGGW